jgi:hypothetical protein
MKVIVLLLVLICPAFAADNDFIVTKTVKWSLLDRIAVALCEAERDDCYRDWRCSTGDSIIGGTQTCITIAFNGETFIWMQYRDKARKAIEAVQ